VARPLSQIVGGIRSVRDYFEQFSKEDPSFLPEWRVAVEIAVLVDEGSTDRTTRDHVRALLETRLADHHDGTGWQHLNALVCEWLAVAEATDP